MAGRIRRKRPRTRTPNVALYPKLVQRWKKWLPDMRRDLSDLFGKRETFWQLQEIAKSNPRIMDPGSFFDWICRNYVVAQAVGVRSFVDQSSDSRCLWRMLYEMLENPGVVSRGMHLRRYRGGGVGPDVGHRTFDNVAGNGRHALSQQAIRGDLRAIEDATERVRRLVNKRIAHRAAQGKLRRPPKFSELDAALDVIDRVFCKYHLLLTATSMNTQRATRQFDWRVVLREPWLPKGHPLNREV